MKIELSMGKKKTTLTWLYLETEVSVSLLGRVDAIYSKEKDLIVAASTTGLIYILSNDGKIIHEFSNGNNEKCKFYLLTTTKYNNLGVNMVMGHNPEYKGERFWQHCIDIESETVGGPISKWR
ncbi:MAG: hypothetical protein GY941_17990 [Planctomycetes bacterium]|nr:hypothetical protein [Planctomycetota bacterium]